MRTSVKLRFLRAAGILLGLSGCGGERALPAHRTAVVRTYSAPEARQAVAVTDSFFYAIDNRTIGKYHRATGRRAARWEAPEGGCIQHLNSGRVVRDTLFAAHSNYPDVPMRSSIEWFDPDSLRHLGHADLGLTDGSATWIDWFEGSWWVGYAHYEGQGGIPGKGPADTHVVQYDGSWRPIADFTFPAEVIRRFGTRSNSGAVFGPDGRLYATGHDAAELYVLALPTEGRKLVLAEILPVTAEGQGIAWAPPPNPTLFTIQRSRRTVIESVIDTR